MLAIVALKSLDKVIVDSGVVPTKEAPLAEMKDKATQGGVDLQGELKNLKESTAEQSQDELIRIEVGKSYCAKICNASVKVI